MVTRGRPCLLDAHRISGFAFRLRLRKGGRSVLKSGLGLVCHHPVSTATCLQGWGGPTRNHFVCQAPIGRRYAMTGRDDAASCWNGHQEHRISRARRIGCLAKRLHRNPIKALVTARHFKQICKRHSSAQLGQEDKMKPRQA